MTKRALVIMAKRPEPGRTKTRLHPILSPETASALYHCFLVDTLALASAVPSIDVILAIDPPGSGPFFAELAPNVPTLVQKGASLGDRLDFVIGTCLDDGYDQVAAINSDSPTLPSSYVSEAFDHLGDPGVDGVFGPTEDGGYYLIGVKGRPGRLVTDVRMSTPSVLADTLRIADELGLVVRLTGEWHDVDEPEDLVRLSREISGPGPVTATATARLLARVSAENDTLRPDDHG